MIVLQTKNVKEVLLAVVLRQLSAESLENTSRVTDEKVSLMVQICFEHAAEPLEVRKKFFREYCKISFDAPQAGRYQIDAHLIRHQTHKPYLISGAPCD